MAFRSMNHWKWVANGFRQYATATPPKMKSYAPTGEFGRLHHHEQQQGKTRKAAPMKGDFVPIYAAIGGIALSVMLGLHTAKQQLMHSPTVYVKKNRRETLPEVVEPEHVLDKADKFAKKSFFRKLAHIQDPNHDHAISDPTRGDAFAHRPRAETLKSVGVDPVAT